MRRPAEHDLVATPPCFAEAIVQHFQPRGAALDAACGADRPFYAALRAVGCKTDWCELTQGRDFFAYQTKVDWIITNPPWGGLTQFINHGMTISREIVYLFHLHQLFYRARLAAIEDAGFGVREALLVPCPPPPWPYSGLQLAAVWLSHGWTGGMLFSRLEC